MRKQQSEIVAVVQQELESIESVKAFGRRDLEQKELAEVSQATVDAALKARIGFFELAVERHADEVVDVHKAVRDAGRSADAAFGDAAEDAVLGAADNVSSKASMRDIKASTIASSVAGDHFCAISVGSNVESDVGSKLKSISEVESKLKSVSDDDYCFVDCAMSRLRLINKDQLLTKILKKYNIRNLKNIIMF